MSESTDPSEPTRLDYPRAARLARSVFSADTRPSVGEPPEVAAARSDPERHFGGYLLIATAGVGGMGEVVRAWQEDLGRWVALKFLKGGVGDLDRFLLEARSAARLDHPGIAKVFETGEHAGRPFIALQWIDGEPLQRVQLAPERAAEVIGETARALAHAHERGVIHRDVKPSNILLTREGKPVLVDFGLARAVDAPQLTQTGTALGTPGFMAPEQASGQAGPLADVYGLGATLYYLTTGRAPHEGATIAELLVRVTQEDPPPPRRWSPRLDRDLETVILHCLAREPGRRYPAAAALAEDLERWRRGEPIHARRVGRGERLWRWARRRPAAAALIAVVALGGPLGVGLALGSADVRRAARGQAAADLAERELLLGRLPEAEAAAERAVATLPAAATGHYWRGRVLLTRYAAARELPPPAVCDGLLELAPPLPEAPESRRCREEALDAFGRMRTAADRRPGPDAVAAGLDALFAHRAGEAAAHLDRAWQAGVIEPDVGLLRVEAHYLARDFAGALAALEELAGRREKGARHLIWEARILQALAVEATLSGNNPMPHLERALRLADAAGAAGAPATDAPVLRAQALLTRAAHEQATGADPEPTLAQAAAALEPGLAAGGCDLLLAWGDVLLARAELRRRIGAVDPAAPAEYQAAIDAFGRAVAARPDYAGGYLRRAAAERALAHFLVGLARCPQDLLRTGREECTRALERAPESELAAVFRTWFERIAALDPPTAAAEGRRAQEQAAADLEARAAASADPARA
ncbi:MAG: serine/threonine protein kinase [Planctomycetes bacterium]|nr:serine/threonine protein kinase [Planctomycetota bacterium]